MSQPYDIQTYLLDKENIRDTLLRMMYAFDHPDSSTLVDLVYTPEVTINYPAHLTGSEGGDMTSQKWAQMVEHLHDEYASTQHVILNVLAELPHPTAAGTVQKPDSCKVLSYSHGIFHKNDKDGLPRVSAGRNGGYYELEAVRLKDKEEKGENPWRIRVQNVKLDWQDIPKA